MDWNASWIWHPPTENPDNFYLYARRAVTLDSRPSQARVYVTAGALYKLYVNGEYVGRGPNPSDPSRYYYDVHEVGELLRAGENVVAVIAYTYGPEPKGALRQNWGPGGLLLEMREGPAATEGGAQPRNRDGEILLVTDASWRVLHAPPWDQDAPINCTLLADYKETYDSRREIDGWMEPGFDDTDWLEPDVLGRPPVEGHGAASSPGEEPVPWTRLIEREIPFLGGERVFPVHAAWESASVTYSWAEDWEVYNEQTLVPGGAHNRHPDEPVRVKRTHEDFAPSITLDFGRDVTGYPEIHVADSAGGIIDVLYAEDAYFVRVDRFVLKGGRQVLQPFNRRTFRYMKLRFAETPDWVHVSEVSMEMQTYPVTRVGRFTCSDEKLNRIWEVGAYTMRMSMLDHYVDCPWRERTLYGGDVYAENRIAHYAFGDPRTTRKCLRQMFAIQHPAGAIPPWGPYRGCPLFYPAWTAYWGLSLVDHYWLAGDAELLAELWPNLTRLLDWTVGQLEAPPRGLMGTPGREVRGKGFDAWMEAEKTQLAPPQNFPFVVLLRRAARLAERIGHAEQADRYDKAADEMGAALRAHFVDTETHLAGSPAAQESKRFGQYDNALLLWSGILDEDDPAADRDLTVESQYYARRRPGPRELDLAEKLLSPVVRGIGAPFHGLFVLDALFATGRDRDAVEFARTYWGDMIDRGATTFWDSFSLDWPAGEMPGRQTSLCHGWAAAPTYALGAWVLGVQPLEPGFELLTVAPQPGGLDWARGAVPTPHGPVEVSWQRTDERFDLSVDIPPGCKARVSLPAVNAPRATVTLNGRPAETEPDRERKVVLVPAGRHTLTRR